MQFDAFCRAAGLIVDRLEVGRWVRVPTIDHPRSQNGAYKFLGDRGYVQNWATMPEPALWEPEEGEIKPVDLERIRRQAEAERKRQQEGHQRAAKRAQELIDTAKVATHPYLQFKGLESARGLVTPDDALLVPMRNVRTNALQGVQVIRWLPDERRYDKRMLPGMKARDAVLRLGAPRAARVWLVEGYATGLSVLEALRMTSSSDAVLVCFSAGNLERVGKQLGPQSTVAFADNDRSHAGEMAAMAAGVPYVMSDVEGEDANDMVRRVGLFKVAALMRSAMGP